MDFWQAMTFLEPEQLVDVAKAAEDVGFAGLMVGEHLATPATIRSRYPYTEDGRVWWDPAVPRLEPWAMASVVASHTETLQFATCVYVLPMHDVFTAAKSISTAACLSQNRVLLGVGPGWMEDEFELTGQDFPTRGRRFDEMLEVLRKLFVGGMVEHHGEFIDFPPLQMSPVPTEPVPVLIGGSSDVAMRRAARWDGWVGGGPYTADELIGHLRRLRAFRDEAGRSEEPFIAISGIATPPDVPTLQCLADEGLTGFCNLPWSYSGSDASTAADKRATLERFAEEIIAPMAR